MTATPGAIFRRMGRAPLDEYRDWTVYELPPNGDGMGRPRDAQHHGAVSAGSAGPHTRVSCNAIEAMKLA